MPKLTFPLYDSVVEDVWISMPKYIQWLKKQRKIKSQAHNINLSILLHSATLVEGFLFDVLYEEIGSPEEIKTLEDRLFAELSKKLEYSTWTTYIELFELITNKKLSSLTPNATWKGILNLFQLRNMLTHGKSIEYKFSKDRSIEPSVNNKYQSTINYLKEVGVIKTPIKMLPVPIIPIVTHESSDHFFNLTVKFIADIHENYLVPKNGEVWDSYSLAFLE